MTIEGLPQLRVIHEAMQSAIYFHDLSIQYLQSQAISTLDEMRKYHEEKKRIACEISERCIIEMDRIQFRKS